MDGRTARWGTSLAGALLLLGGCAGSGESPPPVSASMPDIGTAASTAPVHVVAAGDIACKPGARTTPRSCQAAATARLVTSLDPAAVLALGDLQYTSGSTQEFAGSYARTWGAFRGITRPVPGNHEYLTPGAAGYFRYFGQPKPWYAWNAGQWRIYQLNSNCQDVDCAAQVRWLERDLTQNPRECSAIVLHFPRYSSGLEHGSIVSTTQFWSVAYAHHVDLALAGHDHDYERFAPMDDSGHLRPARGITSFVSGAGGNSLYHHGTTVPGSQFYRASTFGVLDLQLRPGGFDWAFRTVDRTTPDRGSARCV